MLCNQRRKCSSGKGLKHIACDVINISMNTFTQHGANEMAVNIILMQWLCYSVMFSFTTTSVGWSLFLRKQVSAGS